MLLYWVVCWFYFFGLLTSGWESVLGSTWSNYHMSLSQPNTGLVAAQLICNHNQYEDQSSELFHLRSGSSVLLSILNPNHHNQSLSGSRSWRWLPQGGGTLCLVCNVYNHTLWTTCRPLTQIALCLYFNHTLWTSGRPWTQVALSWYSCHLHWPRRLWVCKCSDRWLHPWTNFYPPSVCSHETKSKSPRGFWSRWWLWRMI